MKVILKQDVKGTGRKDDIINVSDGYAKNSLFPKGLAVIADKNNLDILNKQKKNEQKELELRLEEAKELADKISKITITIKTKFGETGKLFGSITNKDLSVELQKFDIALYKHNIILSEPIKTAGLHDVKIKLHPEVSCTLKVDVT